MINCPVDCLGKVLSYCNDHLLIELSKVSKQFHFLISKSEDSLEAWENAAKDRFSTLSQLQAQVSHPIKDWRAEYFKFAHRRAALLLGKSTTTILKGFSSLINQIALSHNFLAATDFQHGNMIRVWDIKKAKSRCVLPGHTNNRSLIRCLEPFGKYFMSGSEDKAIRVWDPKNKKQIVVLTGHGETISCLKDYGNSQIISGSADGTVRLWNLANLNAISSRIIARHQSNINGTIVNHTIKSIRLYKNQVLSLSTTYLVLSNFEINSTTDLLNIRNQNRETITPLKAPLSIEIQDNILAGIYHKCIRIWDLQNQPCLIRTINAPNKQHDIHSMKMSGNELICSYARPRKNSFPIPSVKHHSTIIWNWKTGAKLSSTTGQNSPFSHFSLSSELLFGYSMNAMVVLNRNSMKGKESNKVVTQKREVNNSTNDGMVYTVHNNMIISGYRNGDISIQKFSIE